jgi:hypothetical protein
MALSAATDMLKKKIKNATTTQVFAPSVASMNMMLLLYRYLPPGQAGTRLATVVTLLE